MELGFFLFEKKQSVYTGISGLGSVNVKKKPFYSILSVPSIAFCIADTSADCSYLQ